MATTTAVQGKGAYIVRSSLHRSDLLDESTFMRWYEEDHIPEVISTSRISSARRFVSTDLQADKPYLAMYPMDDIGFTQTKEFQAINVKSDILPGDHPIYDLADFDVRCDKLVHVHNNKEAKGSTKTLVFVASQLKELSDGGISAEELGEWYSQECCPLLQKHKGYLRTTRFKLAFSRNTHQLQAAKGFISSEDAPPPEPGTWLSLHEFDSEPDDVSIRELERLTSSPWAEKVSAGLDRQDIWLYKLANEFGKKDWFYDA